MLSATIVTGFGLAACSGVGFGFGRRRVMLGDYQGENGEKQTDQLKPHVELLLV